MVRDCQIRKVKDTRRKFVPTRKIWKLHEDSVKSDFKSYSNKYRASNQKEAFVDVYWNVLKGAFLRATDRNCGWLKAPARHGMMMLVSASEKLKLRTKWKQGNTSKEKYLEAKKKSGGVITRSNVKQKRKDLKTFFGGMIRNAMCLRL